MSKYNALWEYLQKDDKDVYTLSFDEIAKITNQEIDHSFLTYKKELIAYGYQVGKISMKERTIVFQKTKI